MKNILIIVGIILIVAAGVVWFMGGQQSDQRFPAGYEWEVNSLGQTSFADEETGVFPEDTTLADDPVNITVRSVSASAGEEDGQVVLTDHYQQLNATTNEVEWEFTIDSVVDSTTGQLVDGENAGDYYFIPQNAEKTTYNVTNTTYVNLPLEFQREEDVFGINTYVYEYKGDLPNKAAYTEFIEFADNEDVLCFDFELQYWVEPTTGEIIKSREWCEGDWVVDMDSGEQIYAISRWGTETTGDDLIRQTNLVKDQLNIIRWMSLYIPAILGIAGIALLGYAFVSNPSQSDEGKSSA